MSALLSSTPGLAPGSKSTPATCVRKLGCQSCFGHAVGDSSFRQNSRLKQFPAQAQLFLSWDRVHGQTRSPFGPMAQLSRQMGWGRIHDYASWELEAKRVYGQKMTSYEWHAYWTEHLRMNGVRDRQPLLAPHTVRPTKHNPRRNRLHLPRSQAARADELAERRGKHEEECRQIARDLQQKQIAC